MGEASAAQQRTVRQDGVSGAPVDADPPRPPEGAVHEEEVAAAEEDEEKGRTLGEGAEEAGGGVLESGDGTRARGTEGTVSPRSSQQTRRDASPESQQRAGQCDEG